MPEVSSSVRGKGLILMPECAAIILRLLTPGQENKGSRLSSLFEVTNANRRRTQKTSCTWNFILPSRRPTFVSKQGRRFWQSATLCFLFSERKKVVLFRTKDCILHIFVGGRISFSGRVKLFPNSVGIRSERFYPVLSKDQGNTGRGQ